MQPKIQIRLNSCLCKGCKSLPVTRLQGLFQRRRKQPFEWCSVLRLQVEALQLKPSPASWFKPWPSLPANTVQRTVGSQRARLGISYKNKVLRRSTARRPLPEQSSCEYSSATASKGLVSIFRRDQLFTEAIIRKSRPHEAHAPCARKKVQTAACQNFLAVNRVMLTGGGGCI